MSIPKGKKRPKIDDPFDTDLSIEESNELATFLTDEIEASRTARSDVMDDYGLIDLWHALYLQAPRNRKGPWPGAADLGSYIPMEKVDATRARFVKIVGRAEPLCVAEGRGETAKNAPFVEEFHEWAQQNEEKLLLALIKWWHQGLIERVGILETYEKIERQVTMQERSVLVEVDPQNVDEDGRPAPVMQDGEPVFVKDEDDKFIDAMDGEPAAKVKIRDVRYVHKGPRHRVVSGKDFVWLPAHARDRDEEVWGYFKRVFLTNDDLAERVKDGVYDKEAVEKLGTVGTRPQTATEDRQNITVQHTGHPQKDEHELWEGQVWKDLDGWGPRWHLVTLSVDDRVLLRIKDDTINQCRFNLAVLFLREQGVDGMSQVGDKLFTLAEEHASERNQMADRSALAVNAPILRAIGSRWKPQLQPWAPNAVVDVEHKDDISQVKVNDVPESVIVRERMTLQAAERVSGAADIVSSGVESDKSRTATEVASSAGYSNARLDEQVFLVQEAIERLYALRHVIWIRALEFNGGMEVDESVVNSLKDRGLELEGGKMTAELMRGQWRFKPRGSVESADPIAMERRFQSRYASLFMMAKANPAIAAKIQHPDLADALLQDWADTYKPRDRAAFLRPLPMPMAGPFGPAPGPPGLPPSPPGMAGMLGGGPNPFGGEAAGGM